MEYLQILFSNTNQDQNDILIAQLTNISFDGFQEENDSLKAFIPLDQFDEFLFNSIIDINSFKYSKSIIKEQNWNEQWETDFEPVKVFAQHSSKPFVYIRASFHEPDSAFEYDIEVTPKMSFGTGHHATTYLMVEQMGELDFKDKSVIDFGTGTGVLAILAEKLGAKSILAIDCDDWSINNAKENIVVNNCEAINLVKAENIPCENTADIILANINLNIIAGNIDNIKKASNGGTKILFSGIMLHNEPQFTNMLEKNNMKISELFKRENWLAILAEA
jgi:ribosomal protein L11 methyltransferase